MTRNGKRVLSIALAAATAFGVCAPSGRALAAESAAQGVVAGYFHAMAVKADGSLWTWGGNSYGQLGNGTYAAYDFTEKEYLENRDKFTPKKVMDGVLSVSTGGANTLVIKQDYSLWAWGSLGDYIPAEGGKTGSSAAPVKIMDGVKAAAINDASGFVIKTDGSLWGWGKPYYEPDGTGKPETIATPVKIMGNVKAAAMGNNFYMVLKTDGTLWTFGNNYGGCLGDGKETLYKFGLTTSLFSAFIEEDNNRFTPQKIMDNVASISAGVETAFAVKTDGTLWAWGKNTAGKLGDGTEQDRHAPVKVMSGVSRVSVGVGHTVALKTDGTLWGFGFAAEGALGVGRDDLSDRLSPVKIMDGCAAASAGFEYTAVVKTDGSLWTFGRNDYGKIGDGTVTAAQTGDNNKYAPVKIMDGVKTGSAGDPAPKPPEPPKTAANTEHVAVAHGTNHSLAVRADGSLWAWGENDMGQLGDGTTTSREKPVKIIDSGVVSTASGGWYSLAIKDDNTLWFWGRNNRGFTADGSLEDKMKPVRVASNVTAVAAGAYSILAIHTDGSLWGWGTGYYGDSDEPRVQSTPARVMNNVKAVAMGELFYMAVTNDGALWAWGENQMGQIGDGTISAIKGGGGKTHWDIVTDNNKYKPVKVMDGVADVSCDTSRTIALKTDGTLWAWGNTLDDDCFTPTPKQIAENVKSISAGGLFYLFIKNDDSLWGFGYNRSGQLGNGKREDVAAPIKIMDGVAAVYAGSSNAAAVKKDGSLWYWGNTLSGYFDDEAAVLSPVKKMDNMPIPPQSAPKPGDKLGNVLYTDIKASINGHAIPSYNIADATYILAADLRNYGFDVTYDDDARAVHITRVSGKAFTPLAVPDNKGKLGAAAFPYYATDIKTYLEGRLITSRSVNNATAIPFGELKVYGEMRYDNDARSSTLVMP